MHLWKAIMPLLFFYWENGSKENANWSIKRYHIQETNFDEVGENKLQNFQVRLKVDLGKSTIKYPSK